MIIKEKTKQTHILYDYVYRNGNLGLSINTNIKSMERKGWNFVDIKWIIDENKDNTSFDYLIIFQRDRIL